MQEKIFGLFFFIFTAKAAPSPDAEPAYHAAASLEFALLTATPLAAASLESASRTASPLTAVSLTATPLTAAAYHLTAANCKVENEILVTKSCFPSAENICTKETVDTEEIEYERVCKDVVNTICDDPDQSVTELLPGQHNATIVKREAKFIANYYGSTPLIGDGQIPVIHHAVPEPAVVKTKSPCTTITTKYCVSNPRVKVVPVKVDQCYAVTKFTCANVMNAIPTTKCKPNRER